MAGEGRIPSVVCTLMLVVSSGVTSAFTPPGCFDGGDSSCVGKTSRLVARRPRVDGLGHSSNLSSLAGMLAAASASSAAGCRARSGAQHQDSTPAELPDAGSLKQHISAMSSSEAGRGPDGDPLSGSMTLLAALNQAPKSRDEDTDGMPVAVPAGLAASSGFLHAGLSLVGGGHQVLPEAGVKVGALTGVEFGQDGG